jgi:undecaprenyl-diphosphatase
MIEIFILSFVQGITEFIPVSSSSHLIIISKFLNFTYNNLLVDVSLHIGSFLAIIFYFKNDFHILIKNKKIFIFLLTASLPVIFFGWILVEFAIIEHLRNLKIIGWTTFLFGILLLISDRCKTKKKMYSNLSLYSALLIGFFQILSLVPGVSRSGITITAARFLEFNRVDAAKISFLISIPTLAALMMYGFYSLYNANNLIFSKISLLSVFLSFIFSYIIIKYFLLFLKKFSLTIFVFYRAILGLIILIYAYF